MTPNQTDNVIAGYRNAADAQRQIIADLRHEISILRNKIGALDRHMNACRKIVSCPDDETLAEWLKGCVRLDDPVVTGLAEALRNFEQTCYTRDNYLQAHNALSAYEARVKSNSEPTIQNHGHMNIDYKYNNETTTMSPARVKEVGN